MTMIMIVIYGVSSLINQTLLLRELSIIFQMNEILIGILLFSWLLGNATGSYIFKFFPEKLRNNKVLSPLYLLLSNILVFIFIFIIRWTFSSFQYESTPNIIFTAFIASAFILPISVASGLTFASFSRNSKTSKTYFLEAAAAFSGGVLFTFYLAGNIDSLAISLYLFSASSFFILYKKSTASAVISSAIVITLIYGTFLLSPAIVKKSYELAWSKNSKLLSVTNSKFGNIATVKNGNAETIYYNGRILSHSQSEFYEEDAYLPQLVGETPKNILVLGYAPQGFISHILNTKPTSLTIVSQDRKLYKRVERNQSNTTTKIIQKFMDPFRWTKSSKSNYDLIYIKMDLPTTIAGNRFFTKLFFSSLKHSLTKNGIVYFNIKYEENKIDKNTINNIKTIYNTMEPCFLHVYVVGTSKFHFFGSDVKLYINNEFIQTKLEQLKVKSNQLNPGYFNHYFNKFRLSQISNIISKYRYSKTNKHFEFTVYYNQLRKWFRIHTKSSMPYIIGIMILMLAFIIKKFKSIKKEFLSNRSSLLLFTMGFTSIVGEIYILNFYQSVTGFIYYIYGMLIATYMAGIAFGSIYVLTIKVDRNLLRKIIPYSIPIWLLFIEALYLYEPMHFSNLSTISIVIFAFSFVGGMDIGMIFKLEATYLEDDNLNDSVVTSSLYSFDLLGAALAAILIPTIMLPFLGHIITSIAVIVISSCICFFTSRRFD